jgi:hypothetical protein
LQEHHHQGRHCDLEPNCGRCPFDFQKRCKSSSVWFSSCILEDTQVFAKQIWDGLALSGIFCWRWKIGFHNFHLNPVWVVWGAHLVEMEESALCIFFSS